MIRFFNVLKTIAVILIHNSNIHAAIQKKNKMNFYFFITVEISTDDLMKERLLVRELREKLLPRTDQVKESSEKEKYSQSDVNEIRRLRIHLKELQEALLDEKNAHSQTS